MLKHAWFVAALVWTIAVAVMCLGSFNKLPSIGGQQADKYVHFVFHFMFCALWLGYVRKAYPAAPLRSTSATVFLLALVFGVALEIAQEYFTQTRGADLMDVVANAVGALCGVIVGSQLFRGRQGRQKT